MQYIEYNNIVKRTDAYGIAWPQGPWDSEPDKIQYQDKKTGLPCLIVRQKPGFLCGYVGVSKGHPAYEKKYGDLDISVHGGLTFSDRCHGDEFHICHKTEAGEDDNVWWLGFDCAHSGDVTPGFVSLEKNYKLDFFNNGTYRDIGYVKKQNSKLAKQLKAMS